ncbi:MAG: hypothetical protein AAF591_00250 [Verrucomicrobiota bacterium]
MSYDSAKGRRSDGVSLRVLKDGYWDVTEIVDGPAGERRVRKQSKGVDAPGLWGVEALRREIWYLKSLSAAAASHFPSVVADWDEYDSGGKVGYEIPFYERHRDAGTLAAEALLGQDEIDLFQQKLSEAVVRDLHRPEPDASSLVRHVQSAVHDAFSRLREDDEVKRLIEAREVSVNGETLLGPAAAFERLEEKGAAFRALDAGVQVRIHGDFFLENILWRSRGTESSDDSPQLILIDPVSVAGVSVGPALFDLVKYRSYATGELPALRSEWLVVEGLESLDCRYEIDWATPQLRPFREYDWHEKFGAAFVAEHGSIDPGLYHLLDGYFSIAMAVNTYGRQRPARLLKAVQDFNRALKLTT